MKSQVVIGIASALLLSNVSSAAPPACQRWKLYLTDCQILNKPDGCTVNGLEQEQVNRMRFSSTAKQACKKWVQFLAPQAVHTLEVWPLDSNPNNGEIVDGAYTSARCAWDTNPADGLTTANWTSFVVDHVALTPEDHCFCTPDKGKYKGLSWPSDQLTQNELFAAVFFHAFPEKLKKAILEKNLADHNGHLESDAPHDPNQLLQKTNIYAEDAAEIDHIIPRVDSQGCRCGDPTPENAAVISRELNASMSNTSPKWDLNRAKMYKEFVTCRDPSVAKYVGVYSGPPVTFALEQQDLDEITGDVQLDREPAPTVRSAPYEDEDSGGCTATRSGGLLGIALGAMAFRRRRRR